MTLFKSLQPQSEDDYVYEIYNSISDNCSPEASDIEVDSLSSNSSEYHPENRSEESKDSEHESSSSLDTEQAQAV